MKETEKIYSTIGEVSEICGVAPHILRYWEKEFRSLSPKRDKKGERIYTQKDISFISLIKKLLYEKRYKIEGVKRKLLEEKRKKEGKEVKLFLRNFRKELTSLKNLLKK